MNQTASVGHPAVAPDPHRGRLFRKYLLLIISLVSVALLASSGIGLYFSYQENRAALASLQREKAIGTASRIEQYIRQVSRQLAGGAGDIVSTGRQCQDRQTAGYHDAEVHPAARGPGDRVTWRCYGRSADEVIQ